MNPGSPDALETRLLQRGLPRDYARRLMDEWAEHLAARREDRVTAPGTPEGAAGADTAARGGGEDEWSLLGPPELLVEAAVTQFRSTRWAGRHPVLAFVVTPVMVIWGAWAVAAVTVIALLQRASAASAGARSLGRLGSDMAGDLFDVLGGLLVGLVAVVAIQTLHARSGRPVRWYRVGLVTAGVVGLFLFIRLVPPLGDVPGHLIVRLRPPDSVAQLCAGLIPWLCVTWNFGCRRRTVAISARSVE